MKLGHDGSASRANRLANSACRALPAGLEFSHSHGRDRLIEKYTSTVVNWYQSLWPRHRCHPQYLWHWDTRFVGGIG